MKGERARELLLNILSDTGITLNGSNPWDIKVTDDRFYQRVLRHGSLGLGESYMDGWWECDRLDEFFSRLIPARPEERLGKDLRRLFSLIKSAGKDPGRIARAFQIGERHYDIGNDLYRAMLDRRMVYSCGYWNHADDLNAAQEAKLDLICRKLRIVPRQWVLDIGCGWGGFARYAAERYQARVTGITVSREQAKLAAEICGGLPIDILLQDYRELSGKFDHIVSVGMFEHVTRKHHRSFMKIAYRCLADSGLFLLHTIGSNLTKTANDPWIEKYIFPNSIIPSTRQICAALDGLFIVEDWQNIGADYDRTLMSWHGNFECNWPSLKDRYGERFRRMWRYYLLSSAAAFRTRYMQVWQIVLSKNGVPGGYQSVR